MTIPAIGLQSAKRVVRVQAFLNRDDFRKSLASFLIMWLGWTELCGSFAFATVFLVLLAVHEAGHYIVGRQLGMDITLPFFTPIGALIKLESQPAHAYDEAKMAYAGPLFGTVGAIIAYFLAAYAGSAAMADGVRAAVFLNMFNMIPFSPMDGGRVSMAIDRRLWPIGIAAMGMLVIFMSPDFLGWIVIAFLAIMGLLDVAERINHAQEDPGYYDVGTHLKVFIAGLYAILLLVQLTMLL